MNWNVAVIGGGIAGLTAAATLSQLGYQVTLFEREKYLGGATSLGICGWFHSGALFCWINKIYLDECIKSNRLFYELTSEIEAKDWVGEFVEYEIPFQIPKDPAQMKLAWKFLNGFRYYVSQMKKWFPNMNVEVRRVGNKILVKSLDRLFYFWKILHYLGSVAQKNGVRFLTGVQIDEIYLSGDKVILRKGRSTSWKFDGVLITAGPWLMYFYGTSKDFIIVPSTVARVERVVGQNNSLLTKDKAVVYLNPSRPTNLFFFKCLNSGVTGVESVRRYSITMDYEEIRRDLENRLSLIGFAGEVTDLWTIFKYEKLGGWTKRNYTVWKEDISGRISFIPLGKFTHFPLLMRYILLDLGVDWTEFIKSLPKVHELPSFPLLGKPRLMK